MEPERKIEKLLRAFAKKRRADAGDSLKLHPATRRLLQDEVARRQAQSSEEDSVSLWQFFRQQWAVLLSFALVIFFGVALFLPALSKAKFKAKNVVAMSYLKEIGVAAQTVAAENNGKLPVTLDALTNELISAKALTDPVSGQRFVYAAGGEKLDELQSNSVLVYSPVDKKGRAVLLADGSVQTMNAGQFDVATRRGLMPRAAPPMLAGKPSEATPTVELAVNRPAAMAAPTVAAGTVTSDSSAHNFGGGRQTAAPTFANDGLLAKAEPKQRFQADDASFSQSGLNNNSQRFRRILTAAAKTPPVLASFEVQQNGNALAVVDRDGSVYTGSIQPEISAVQGQALAVAPSPSDKTKDLGQAKNEASVSQNNYFFRVAGQNRTSKQNIVFVGNVVPLTNTLAGAQQNQAGNALVGGALASVTNSQNGLNSQSQVLLFSNARITGTVTVDATNRIEINAMPVTP
jgi:hypothetical protein